MLRRPLRLAAAACLLAFLPSCARILYPERVGNTSGRVDVVPLVVDILLFIPGLIPGVIAIVVDFGTGAIYVQGKGGAALSDVGRLALRTAPGGVEFVVLESFEGEVLAFAPVSSNPGVKQLELVPVTPSDELLAVLQQP